MSLSSCFCQVVRLRVEEASRRSLGRLHLAVTPWASLLRFLPLSGRSARGPRSTPSFPAQPCRLHRQRHSSWAWQAADGNSRLTILNHQYLTICACKGNFISTPSHSRFANWTPIHTLAEISLKMINLVGQRSQQTWKSLPRLEEAETIHFQFSMC